MIEVVKEPGRYAASVDKSTPDGMRFRAKASVAFDMPPGTGAALRALRWIAPCAAVVAIACALTQRRD